MYPSVFFKLLSTPANVPNLFQKAKIILTDVDAFYQLVWDAKSDEDIKVAYDDNLGWQSNYRFLKMTESKQSQDNLRRWDTYIKPQIIKRDLKLPIPE